MRECGNEISFTSYEYVNIPNHSVYIKDLMHTKANDGVDFHSPLLNERPGYGCKYDFSSN